MPSRSQVDYRMTVQDHLYKVMKLQWLQVMTQAPGEHNASGSCTITVEAMHTSKAQIYIVLRLRALAHLPPDLCI